MFYIPILEPAHFRSGVTEHQDALPGTTDPRCLIVRTRQVRDGFWACVERATAVANNCLASHINQS